MPSAIVFRVPGLLSISLFAARLTLANVLTAPEGGQVITADEPFDITWETDSTGPVKIQLLYGDNKMVGNITG